MDAKDLLYNLIKIDSSTTEYANRCIEMCSEFLDKRGIEGNIIEHNGVKSYVSLIGKGEKTLILNGHLDVVSGKPDQFSPYELEGCLFGRGTADMKSGVMSIISAFSKLSQLDLNCQVMLQLVADEECGGLNGTKHLVDLGYVGDFVICTEPTNMNISVSAKGILRLDVITKGVAAHGSRPWEGENAIVKSLNNFERINNLPILNKSSKYYECSSVNLAFIKGGDIYNRVPDEAIIGLDIRYVPEVNPNEIIEAIQGVVDGELIVRNIEPSVYVSEECKYVKALVQSIETVSADRDVKLIGQHGTSDARFFSGKGIPAIEFGPVGKAWHGDGEFVALDSLDQLERILVDFAFRFAQE